MTFHSTPTAKFAHDHGMTEDALVHMLDEVIDAALEPGEPDDRFVSEDDVKDAYVGLMWGYGGDHRVYFPAADE